MENVTDRVRNPFDMHPPCGRFVPGYGDANADVHAIGDHPGRHGGAETGIPFTGSTSGERLQSVLAEVGLLESPGDEPLVSNLYLSYLYMCVDDESIEGEDPSEDAYSDLERFFDAELRAITADVLLPIGERAIRHVLRGFTTYPMADLDVDAVHATEVSGGGWLVVPLRDPADWTDDDRTAAVDALTAVLGRDFRRESDLGRFLTGPDPYLVR